MRNKSNFTYALQQGIKGTFKNRTMSFISIISVTAVLIILGVVMSVVTNINEAIRITKDEVNEIRVIVNSNLEEETRLALEEEILNVDQVVSSEFVTKDEAFQDMQEGWGEDGHLLEGIDNPLDDYFLVTVDDSQQMETIAKNLMAIENIIEVDYHQDIMENFIQISTTLTQFGAIIILFLSLICLVLISNTVRSKVHSKKDEIQIIKYVGGSNIFITSPFIIEGFIIGALGSILAIVASLAIYDYTIINLSIFDSEIITDTLLTMNEIATQIVPVLLALGVVIGVLGSIISVKRYLKV